MNEYRAPLQDMQFVLNELAGFAEVACLPGHEELHPEMLSAVLEESAKFSTQVLSALNVSGDRERLRWQTEAAGAGGRVIMPAGFKEAYQQFVDAGWNGHCANPEFGGQGLPRVLGAAVQEMWMSANLSFSLCPLLTVGAIEALELCGSDEQKQTYLPKLIHGSWTGTMNLTEPQAGSDLAAIRTRAVPQADGSYRISGQKIFITFGDHDMSENIIHLVLARTPDAPAGVKGISLFVVPKFLVNADGTLGARNDAWCVSIEEKLGIHACPTCVMAFGGAPDSAGAIGYRVGEENAGLKYMFIMMNAARFAVGLEGLGVAERAWQRALNYARERVQGRDISGKLGGDVTIARHPDVRRMLMLMKSQVEAMRALAYTVAAWQDLAQKHPAEAVRKQHQALVDLMIPIVKAWLTETGNEVASLGVQVHGGMGFIEETGAAQYLRDARITTIYEGTTGIQANDLMGRKIARENGVTVQTLLQQMRTTVTALQTAGTPEFASLASGLEQAVNAAQQCVTHILAHYEKNIAAVSVGAVPFIKLMGLLCGGWQLGRAALVAQKSLETETAPEHREFYQAKIQTALFFNFHLLIAATGLARVVEHGGAAALSIPEAGL